MELKLFIKRTLQSLIDASEELITENQARRVYINPLRETANDQTDDVSFIEGFQPVTGVRFDLAVTGDAANPEGAVIEVLAREDIAAEKADPALQSISRISFAMRIVLPATPPHSGLIAY